MQDCPAPAVLADIHRMARNGMTVGQIGARLGWDSKTLDDLALRFPPVKDALVRGRLEGVDLATTRLMEAVEAGDLQAIKLYLERRGGWAAPAKAAAPATLIQVNSGSAYAMIDASNVDRLAADHADLLDQVAAGKLAAPATLAPPGPPPPAEAYRFEVEG